MPVDDFRMNDCFLLVLLLLLLVQVGEEEAELVFPQNSKVSECASMVEDEEMRRKNSL